VTTPLKNTAALVTGSSSGIDVADAIAYIVTRDRRVAVNEILVRAGDQTCWRPP
jgi:hypothetical protein